MKQSLRTLRLLHFAIAAFVMTSIYPDMILFVAAPLSSVDIELADGSKIPINLISQNRFIKITPKPGVIFIKIREIT
ncbi:hypothetical protein CDG79_35310 [Nostoc sp. 'Peltigera membranacea cyanobiont' 232]|nr:hypothetical protein CDG79_35310 [Nostoc sp. 'Peltigera membranacea cyanobiont' 232]